MSTHQIRRRRREEGATLVTFALSITAICVVIALVIGGSWLLR